MNGVLGGFSQKQSLRQGSKSTWMRPLTWVMAAAFRQGLPKWSERMAPRTIHWRTGRESTSPSGSTRDSNSKVLLGCVCLYATESWEARWESHKDAQQTPKRSSSGCGPAGTSCCILRSHRVTLNLLGPSQLWQAGGYDMGTRHMYDPGEM